MIIIGLLLILNLSSNNVNCSKKISSKSKFSEFFNKFSFFMNVNVHSNNSYSNANRLFGRVYENNVEKKTEMKNNNKPNKPTKPKKVEIEDLGLEISILKTYLSLDAFRENFTFEENTKVLHNQKKICYQNNDDPDDITCRLIESLVYHGKSDSAIVDAHELDKYRNDLKSIFVNFEIYKQVVENLIVIGSKNKYQKNKCKSMIASNVLNCKNSGLSIADNTSKIKSEGDGKQYNVILLCAKNDEELKILDEFKSNVNNLYNDALLPSKNYFSIYQLPNSHHIPIRYYTEGSDMGGMEKAKIVISDRGLQFTGPQDVNCSDIRATQSFLQYTSCYPRKVNSDTMKIIPNMKNDELELKNCFEFVVDLKQASFSRNIFCISEKDLSDNMEALVLKKLLETTLSKNCLITQAKNYKQLLNNVKNRIKCMYNNKDGSQTINNLNDQIRFKNAAMLAKILLSNVRYWRSNDKERDPILFLGENFKDINTYLVNVTQEKNINHLLSLKDPVTKKYLPESIKELLNTTIEKEISKIKADIEKGMVGSVDAEISPNMDWMGRGSTKIDKVPVNLDDNCNDPVKPRVDTAKDLNNLENRLKVKKQKDLDNIKADEEAKIKEKKEQEDRIKKKILDKIKKDNENKQKEEDSKLIYNYNLKNFISFFIFKKS